MRVEPGPAHRRRRRRGREGRAAGTGRRRLRRDASDREQRRGSERGGRARVTDRLSRAIGVSQGIAVGPAVVLQWALPEVPHATVPRAKVEKEIRRLRAAVRDVKRHIADIKARAESRAGVDAARIFDPQMLMLEDRTFIGAVEELIKENHLTAEKASEYTALQWRYDC